MIEKIIFVPLYGRINEFVTIADALQFLDQHDIYKGSGDFLKYEILVNPSSTVQKVKGLIYADSGLIFAVSLHYILDDFGAGGQF